MNFGKFLGTAFFENNSGELLRRVIVIFERKYSFNVKHVFFDFCFFNFFCPPANINRIGIGFSRRTALKRY